MGRYVSLIVLLVMLLVLGVMFYQLMTPFLMPMFLAAVTAIVAAPLYEWMLGKCRQHRGIAAGITTGFLVFMVLIPAAIVTFLAAKQLAGFVQPFLKLEFDQKLVAWHDFIDPWTEAIASSIPNYSAEELEADIKKNVKLMADGLSSNTLRLASSTMGALTAFLVGLTVYLLSLYFFLADGPTLVSTLRDLVPVANEQQDRMILEFTKVTRAVVTATLFAAIAQGLMTAAALKFLGFGNFMVFLVLSTLLSLVPLVGAWMVWLPCAAILFANGHYAAAIGLTAYGLLGVGLVDNVVRMYVLNTDAQLHPLLALLSVMGALNVMGLWGIFIGPIIAACFTAALRIANQELRLLTADLPKPDPDSALTT